jgi:hypothetical protein
MLMRRMHITQPGQSTFRGMNLLQCPQSTVAIKAIQETSSQYFEVLILARGKIDILSTWIVSLS